MTATSPSKEQAWAAREKVKSLCSQFRKTRGVALAWDEEGTYFVRVDVDPKITEKELRNIPKEMDNVPVRISRAAKMKFHSI